MLETSVQVSLLPKAAYAPEMRVIDVGIHPEKPLEHGSHHLHEVLRERNAILLWENPRIIHLQVTQALVVHLTI